ncbi:TetR/AcrR family transcriptional regulator C-terminal domain-containing protein [Duganella sp. PWIR1]
MKKRTETRRQAILLAAAQVFEAGFERASMSAISDLTGYSKATLYSYFSSKEELFFNVVVEATEAQFQATHGALDPAIDDIAVALQAFGERLLSFIYSPQVRSARRLIVSEAGRSDLGRRCYELGPARSETAVAAFLAQAMDAGKLRRADPRIAGLHLKGLLDAEWSDSVTFQTVSQVSSTEASGTAARAVAVFMAAYGPV